MAAKHASGRTADTAVAGNASNPPMADCPRRVRRETLNSRNRIHATNTNERRPEW